MSCLLCNLNLDEFKSCKIGWKGLKTLIQCSIDRKDNLADTLRSLETLTIHDACRRKYTHRRYNGKLLKFSPPVHSSDDSQLKFEYIPIPIINKNASTNVPRAENTAENLPAMDNNTSTNNINSFEMRTKINPINPDNTSETPDRDISVNADAIEACPEPEIFCNSQPLSDDDDPTKPFPFQHNCFICGKFISKDRKKPPKSVRVCSITQESTIQKILRNLKTATSSRCLKVLQRIQGVDLIQVKARYHINCYLYFHQKKGQRGRPICPLVISAVDKICRYIDRCDRTEFTTTELMTKELHGDYIPDWRSVEKKLEMRYPGKIFFTPMPGRSTVVTVIKDSRPGGSMVVQPWNLNSTELGGQGGTVEEVIHENLRSKQVQLNERIRVKRKKKKLLEANNTIYENKFYEEKVPESIENDNDFIDETFDYREDNVADFKENILICQICLSSDRRLEDLGDYKNIVRKICCDIFIENFEPKLFLVCWECIALLKNVQHFQKKIMIAQKLWNTEVQEPPKSLSTLSITTPSTASVSYIDGNESILSVHDQNLQANIKPEVVAVDFLTQDLKPQKEDEKVAEVENYNMYDDVFDYDTKDMNVDDDSEDQEMIPLSKRRKARAKRNNIVYKTEQDSEDETYTPKQKTKRKSSSNRKLKQDPDWEDDTVQEKSKKQEKLKKKRIKVKIPYTILVQTYITATKMKREPIEPQELQYWLDAERNSDYFKNSIYKKCIKCILEVPDNHDKLCHSEEHPYVCKICECTFASKEEQDTHETNHYYIFSCEFCRYKCYNETHMSHHVESHRRLIQCLECFAAFETLDILKEHFNKLHRYAECDQCGKRFAHKRTVKTHIERCHTPQICTICNTRYSSYTHKMHHMNLKHRVERTEAAYCVQCDIQFDNVALLKRHVYHNVRHKHEWKREPLKKEKVQHKCPECDNVYASKHTFRCHYNLVHAKKITFYCKYCDKPFPSNANYKSHMRRQHEGYELPKNKFCHICGRGFSTNRILTNHIRTHTGERPYACPHCASSFAQKAALRSHVAHVHEKRRRTTEPGAKRRQSAAEPTDFLLNSSIGII